MSTEARVALLGVALLGFVWATVVAHPPPEVATGLAAERAQRDATIWKSEREAQARGRSIVDWWDRLRSGEEPGALLDSLGLARLVDAGVLSGSEWHHIGFDPEKGTSMVEAVLHWTTEGNAPARATKRATFVVQWSDAPGDDGQFEVRGIEWVELTTHRRKGPPAFTVAFEKRGGSGQALAPLVARDLDGDGRDEVLALGANLRLSYREGRWEEAPLVQNPLKNALVGALYDLNGDGNEDLVVSGPRKPLLVYLGDWHGGFEAMPTAIGPEGLVFENPKAVTGGDIDGDGDVDLWVAQYKPPYLLGQMPTPYYDANDGFPAHLLRNDGEGRFVDVTGSAGLGPKSRRRTYSGSLVDLDDDGDLDLFVVSDHSGVDVYRNDGTGAFTDVTGAALDERASFGMSHTFGDFNRDGTLDAYVIGMSSATARRLDGMGLGPADHAEHQRMRGPMTYGNRLYFGRGDGTFEQAPDGGGAARSGWSWGVAAFDLENDGDADLYVANGNISGESARDYCATFWTHDIYDGSSDIDPQLAQFFQETSAAYFNQGGSWNGFEHNALFVNDGDGLFGESGHLAGLALPEDSRAVLPTDFDGDGRVDLVVTDTNRATGVERLRVLHNRTVKTGHWIGVRLTPSPAASPWGARVAVRTWSGTQVGQVVSGESFDAERAPVVHFGLGKVDRAGLIEVKWPDGRVTRIEGPAVDRYHAVTPP